MHVYNGLSLLLGIILPTQVNIVVTMVMSHSIETTRSSIPVVAKKPKKHSMRRSLLPQEMPTDDYLNVLKKAFQYYCEENTVSTSSVYL